MAIMCVVFLHMGDHVVHCDSRQTEAVQLYNTVRPKASRPMEYMGVSKNYGLLTEAHNMV